MEADPWADWLGSIGVAILLAAFAANIFSLLPAASRRYQVANALGAGLSCYASYLIGFMPFVVLEGTWCLVAVASLVSRRKQV